MNDMTDKFRYHHKRMDQLNQWLDLLLHAFSTYALPLVIGLLSLLAIFSWKSQYAVTPHNNCQSRLSKGLPKLLDLHKRWRGCTTAPQARSMTPDFQSRPYGFLSSFPKTLQTHR